MRLNFSRMLHALTKTKEPETSLQNSGEQPLSSATSKRDSKLRSRVREAKWKDPTFKYTTAVDTDLRRTFARLQKKQRSAQPKEGTSSPPASASTVTQLKFKS